MSVAIAIAIARAAHVSIPRHHTFDSTLLVHLAKQNALVELLLTWWNVDGWVLCEEVHWFQSNLDYLNWHHLFDVTLILCLL